MADEVRHLADTLLTTVQSHRREIETLMELADALTFEFEAADRVLQGPRARPLLSAQSSSQCSSYVNRIAALRKQLQRAASAADTFGLCHQRAQMVTETQLPPLPTLDRDCVRLVQQSLDRMHCLAQPRRTGESSKVDEECCSEVRHAVVEWELVQQLQRELGEEAGDLLSSTPTRAPADAETRMLTFALESRRDGHKQSCRKLQQEIEQLHADIAEQTSTLNSKLQMLTTVEEAVSATRAAADDAATRQREAYRDAWSTLQHSFQRSVESAREPLSEVTTTLTAEDAELAEFEDAVAQEFLSHPVHQRIHDLAVRDIGQTLQELEWEIAARSSAAVSSSFHLTHPGVRHTFRNIAKLNLERQKCDYFVVSRDQATKKFHLIQPSGQKCEVSVSEDGKQFIIERSNTGRIMTCQCV